jgi:hypothetical protein
MNLQPLKSLFAAILLTGCSSATTQVDSGAIHGSTFSFVTVRAKATPDYGDGRQAVHAMIQDSITRDLTAKGMSKVDSGGDVTVAYLVIVGNNATTESVNDYFGYGRDAAALAEKAHSAYTGGSNMNYFEAGTLLIDLVDSKTSKLLKRGYVTRPAIRNLPENERSAQVQEAVDQILRDVRIVP